MPGEPEPQGIANLVTPKQKRSILLSLENLRDTQQTHLAANSLLS